MTWPLQSYTSDMRASVVATWHIRHLAIADAMAAQHDHAGVAMPPPATHADCARPNGAVQFEGKRAAVQAMKHCLASEGSITCMRATPLIDAIARKY